MTVEVHTGVFTDASFLPVLTRLAEACCEHHGGGDQSLRGSPGPSAPDLPGY